MEADEGWFKRGAGSATKSNPTSIAYQRVLSVISALIEYPTEGLILFETGGGKEYPSAWGAPLNDIFAQDEYKSDQELDVQISKTGHSIKDIKAVVMVHLHLDHAGEGSKHAYYSVATGSDLGVYLPKDLPFDLNWPTFHGDFLELCEGITLRHSPGHTPGLVIMQVNLKESGTWIFKTDQYHGWLARDHDDWVRSHQMIKMLAKRTNARLVFGHCKNTFDKYEHAPHAYQ
ncbi:beta-lactamase-like protein [Phyllosticta citrichinensis]|uniref:Beta-lactamase-like protein n=1 Tax=Phyllosticta citrichinensis TaxID=1130410 RepID=A0ABR1XIK4_9PEZI